MCCDCKFWLKGAVFIVTCCFLNFGYSQAGQSNPPTRLKVISKISGVYNSQDEFIANDSVLNKVIITTGDLKDFKSFLFLADVDSGFVNADSVQVQNFNVINQSSGYSISRRGHFLIVNIPEKHKSNNHCYRVFPMDSLGILESPLQICEK